jgi:bifunctional non-homologous end joining protein LigD
MPDTPPPSTGRIGADGASRRRHDGVRRAPSRSRRRRTQVGRGRGSSPDARREILERLVDGAPSVLPVRRLASNGHQAWREVLARGIEGYVGKDPGSTYLTGGPTRTWLKAKVRREGHFLVGGVVERSDGWSLLLGSMENGVLVYRGLVHFGVGQRLADALKDTGLVRKSSPFSVRIPERGVIWLEPTLTAEVSYAEILHGGALRAAVFRGFV